jgi:uncharacterized protein (TIGR02266 family)
MERWTAPTPEEHAEIKRAEAAVREAKERYSGRKLPRVVLNARVTAQSEDNFFSGLTENISEGGVFVATFSPPSVGERIRINLSVDNERDLSVAGVVRWHRYDDAGDVTGCGVQFSALSSEQVRRIRTLMVAIPREPLLTDF